MPLSSRRGCARAGPTRARTWRSSRSRCRVVLPRRRAVDLASPRPRAQSRRPGRRVTGRSSMPRARSARTPTFPIRISRSAPPCAAGPAASTRAATSRTWPIPRAPAPRPGRSRPWSPRARPSSSRSPSSPTAPPRCRPAAAAARSLRSSAATTRRWRLPPPMASGSTRRWAISCPGGSRRRTWGGAEMDARQIIAGVRDRKGLPAEAATWFASGLASGAVTDAQAGAFAMAVLLNRLDDTERVAWTLAMRDSGSVLDWNLPGPVVDKHSTGGIGDSTSILLAPALAACGAYVPMISGRGLGHTGGTLDKLEAIPGYRTDVTVEELRRLVRDVGCAIVGATADVAPADRRLYAIRDVTGTVESIDLITASILSKMVAAGLESLILDVKVDSGAFMKTIEDARALAHALVDTANGAGCRTAALITDMDQPLASTAGNALEVIEAMETMTGAAVNQA